MASPRPEPSVPVKVARYRLEAGADDEHRAGPASSPALEAVERASRLTLSGPYASVATGHDDIYSQATDRMAVRPVLRHLPKLPVFSVHETTGDVIIVSRREAKRRTAAYVAERWRRLRDSSLPARQRLDCLAQILYCTFEFPYTSTVAKVVNGLLVVAVLVNAFNVIAGSFQVNEYRPTGCPDPICVPGPESTCSQPVCRPIQKDALMVVNALTVLIFTLDYVLRLLTVHTVPTSVLYSGKLAIDLKGDVIDTKSEKRLMTRGGWRKTWAFATSWFGVIDLLSIIPFFANLLSAPFGSFRTWDSNTSDFFIALRVVRVLKLLKYSKQGLLFARTILASLPALQFFVFLASILSLCFATFAYYLERGEFMITPEHPTGAFYRKVPHKEGAMEVSPFNNILISAYWVVVNTTSVKGPLAPSSTEGQVLAVVLAFFGTILIALPLGVVSRQFQVQYDILNTWDDQSHQYAFADEPNLVTPGRPPKAAPEYSRITSRGGGSYLVRRDEDDDDSDDE